MGVTFVIHQDNMPKGFDKGDAFSLGQSHFDHSREPNYVCSFILSRVALIVQRPRLDLGDTEHLTQQPQHRTTLVFVINAIGARRVDQQRGNGNLKLYFGSGCSIGAKHISEHIYHTRNMSASGDTFNRRQADVIKDFRQSNPWVW
jgi:hypothetical protein